jgi:amino acid permease
MARAVKLTFFRIVIFYILSVLFLGMVVPYNSPQLEFATGSTTSAAASPFVVAIKLAKIEVLDHIINACLLIFVISAATSGTSLSLSEIDHYMYRRFLFGLTSNRLLYCYKNNL